MNFELLRKSAGTTRLILIVAGWASDAASYRHVNMPGWDVAVLWGIDAVVPDLSCLKQYRTVYLYAWSLGVFVADRLLAGAIDITSAFAINGTTLPYSDDCGIPTHIFDGTARGLTERGLSKFRMRMFDSVADYKEHASEYGAPSDIGRLRDELYYVAGECSRPSAASIDWTSVFIGRNDRIFPVGNQERAWLGKAPVQMLDAPHYIDIQDVVRRTIVNVERVGDRFSRSMGTYNAHAHAQRVIAERLVDEFMAGIPNVLDNLVEIGPGTGLLTRCWGASHRVAFATFIDLCDMADYGVASSERYFCEDAEVVMARLAATEPGTVDAVVSASAIQWFSNLDYFFSCCASVLRHGGRIAMSTFAPGNLSELHALRPDHLRYLPVDVIREILDRYFQDVRVVEDVVELDFTSPLEALRHLQLTGVTSSGHKSAIGELRRFAEAYPVNSRGRYSLSFRPIYISATKKG